MMGRRAAGVIAAVLVTGLISACPGCKPNTTGQGEDVPKIVSPPAVTPQGGPGGEGTPRPPTN